MKKATCENKRHYITRLSLLISSDYRSDVESIRYEKEGEEEFAEITFCGGHVVAVNITVTAVLRYIKMWDVQYMGTRKERVWKD